MEQARERCSAYIRTTPIEVLESGERIKLENVNLGHSFKIRGALNAILGYSENAFVTASTGNFGNALSISGEMIGADVTVVVPESTTAGKIRKIERRAKRVMVAGRSLDDAELYAHQIARSDSLRYISPYNDALVIAGGGVIGLELADQCPNISTVYVPTGGGGLVTGIAAAMSRRPGTRIVACCPDHSTAFMSAVLGTGNGVPGPSMADALVGGIEADSITIDLARIYNIEFSLVSEDQIAKAVVALMKLGWLVEPAAAVSFAAMDRGGIKGNDTVSVITGSNVDLNVIRSLITTQ